MSFWQDNSRGDLFMPFRWPFQRCLNQDARFDLMQAGFTLALKVTMHASKSLLTTKIVTFFLQ